MTDPLTDRDRGGSSKRPAYTIEGTATEVSVEPAPEADARTEASPGTGQTAAGAEADADPKDEKPTAASGRAGSFKRFMTHLAAGLLGGLIGVVAIALAWDALDLGHESAPAIAIAALDKRLAQLEAASSASADAIAELKSRAAALETGTEQASPELGDLTNRIAKLENSLKSLAETAEDGGSVAAAAAIEQGIAEAEQRLDAKIASALAETGAASEAAFKQIQGELAELKAKIGALAEAGLGSGEALAPEVTALGERIAKLEESLPALEEAVGKEAAVAKSAAIAIAFTNLRAAIGNGKPYAAELDTLGALSPSLGDLGVLPAHAENGIPTFSELAQAFEEMRASAEAAATPSPDGSFLGNLMASAQSLVKIRPLDAESTGDGPEAALARAKAALDKGELAAAVKEVETLEGAPRTAFSAWLGDAHARLAADAILARLEGALLVSFGEETPAQQP